VITLLKLSPYTGDLVAPSPNHDARKAPAIEGIVLHATEDGGDEAYSLAWLRSPKSRVSCHLLVTRGGRVTRLVGDRQRAWHAGLSNWHGTSDVNSITWASRSRTGTTVKRTPMPSTIASPRSSRITAVRGSRSRTSSATSRSPRGGRRIRSAGIGTVSVQRCCNGCGSQSPRRRRCQCWRRANRI